MSKYQLVAFYYDMFEKDPTKKYKYQEIIDQEKLGIDLSTLQAIDRFTAQYDKVEILQILEQKLGITGKNHLLIKYKKNQNSNADYFGIMEKNKEFVNCIKIGKLDKEKDFITYWAFGEKRKAIKVDETSEFFQRELSYLRKLLEDFKYDEIKKNFPFEKSWLLRLVNQYFYAPHDNVANEREYWKILIEKEFKCYKTFRDWVITKKKNKANIWDVQTTKRSQNIPKSTPKKLVVRTQKEYEEEFLRNYQEKNKCSWEEMITRQYNSCYDENLTSEEFEVMFGLKEENLQPTYHTMSKKRR